jgi:ABC-type Fe3+/spermidine/putrescine transport system ATPase subunit
MTITEESRPAVQLVPQPAPDGDAAGVKLVDLQRRYGEVEALAGISLDIRRGSFTTLLGPSGCGKSTTLRLIAGLDRPDGGTISIGPTVVSSGAIHVPPQKRRVGFVFQSYALWPHMTVAGHILYALKARHVPRDEMRDRVAEILQLVGLSHVHDRHPYELSGGQQQRVAVARALATDPQVLLLDEPLSNLDAELRTQMRAELRRVHDRTGLTTILVTHDQAEALSMSDEVVLMQLGKIIDVGRPTDLYQRPSTHTTATFVGSSNMLTGTATSAAAAEELVAVELADGSGEVVHGVAQVDVAAGSQVELAIKPEDIEIRTEDGQAPGDNDIACAVVHLIYYGSHTLLTLRMHKGGGIELRAWGGKNASLAVGDEVVVRLPSERVSVLLAGTA